MVGRCSDLHLVYGGINAKNYLYWLDFALCVLAACLQNN